jgi:N-carbamoyl-L-amino-acid hydrolase
MPRQPRPRPPPSGSTRSGTRRAKRNAPISCPAGLGPDPTRLERIGAFVELHVEQGRALVDLDAPVGVASAIWPHGRWRMDFTGEGNHAGTTRMEDRHDPMLTFAYAVLAANEGALARGAHATVGRVEVTPNATNAIPSGVAAWLDARAADADTLASLVETFRGRVGARADRDGTGFTLSAESESPVVEFDTALRDRLAGRLGNADRCVESRVDRHVNRYQVPILPTGAGHDAGVLAAHVPTAMLFVRNPTGVSHAPAEYATDTDCALGVSALADALEELAC